LSSISFSFLPNNLACFACQMAAGEPAGSVRSAPPGTLPSSDELAPFLHASFEGSALFEARVVADILAFVGFDGYLLRLARVFDHDARYLCNTREELVAGLQQMHALTVADGLADAAHVAVFSVYLIRQSTRFFWPHLIIVSDLVRWHHQTTPPRLASPQHTSAALPSLPGTPPAAASISPAAATFADAPPVEATSIVHLSQGATPCHRCAPELAATRPCHLWAEIHWHLLPPVRGTLPRKTLNLPILSGRCPVRSRPVSDDPTEEAPSPSGGTILPVWDGSSGLVVREMSPDAADGAGEDILYSYAAAARQRGCGARLRGADRVERATALRGEGAGRRYEEPQDDGGHGQPVDELADGAPLSPPTVSAPAMPIAAPSTEGQKWGLLVFRSGQYRHHPDTFATSSACG
jgi:hypothetical protein